jgi:hypothetical protein
LENNMMTEDALERLPKTFTLPVPANREARQLLGRIIRGQEEPHTVWEPLLDGQETITVHPFSIFNMLNTEPELAAFFVGDRDNIEAFTPPRPGREIDAGITIIDPATGERTRYRPENPLEPEDDRALARLRALADGNRPFEWGEDPRRDTWEALLDALGSGRPDEPVKGKTQELWDILLAVARADRFNEGVLYEHAYPLTRIASELRRRLLGM